MRYARIMNANDQSSCTLELIFNIFIIHGESSYIIIKNMVHNLSRSWSKSNLTRRHQESKELTYTERLVQMKVHYNNLIEFKND